jgi:hypothetical protein
MELVSVLKDYILTEHTDYALLISGDWGSGKTYFLKNELFKSIRETKIRVISKDKILEEYCEPIYVSLYGIKEISEIDKRVFLELNPRLKSRPAFFLNLLASKLIGIINMNWLNKDDLKDYLSIFNIPARKILCFDDLERIHKDVLDEALGYINSFVEHQNIKVLIVGDETILSEKVDGYDKTKEKLIRFTYKFSPDIRQAFDSFLKPYSQSFKEFLIANKTYICEIFNKGQHNNLRTLRFCLDLLAKVFEAIEKLELNEKYKTEILDRITFFTITFSIEYKKTNDKAKLSELQQINSQNILLASLPSLDQLIGKKIDVDSNPTFKDIFSKTYLPFENHYFNYFDVIASLAYTGFLDINKLHSDIKEMSDDLKRKETTQESILIQKMSDCFVLNDEEFEPLINEILKKVETGYFDLPAYPNLYTRLLQIEHYQLGGFKIDESVAKKFEKGIDISKHRAKYVDAFRWKIPIWEVPNPKYNRISEYAIQANDSLLNNKVQMHSAQIIPLFENTNGDELYNYLIDIDYRNLPVFAYINSKDIFEKLKKSNNLVKYGFLNGLKERYKDAYASESNKKEFQFFSDLHILINDHIKNQKIVQISTIAFMEISKVIKSIITKQSI